MRRLTRTAIYGRLQVVLPLLLVLAFSVGEAIAQPKPADSLACRRQCGATFPDRTHNPQSVQICLIRCAAGESHLSRQHQRGTPEATGRGAAPAPAPRPAPPGTPAIAGVPSGWPPRPGSAPAGRSLVAYVSPPPGRGFSISMPVERMAAHRGAETDCFRRNNNNPCRLLTETQERCLALAYGVRANGLVITADPRTFTVHHYGSGSGPNETTAQFAALRDCSGRMALGVSCRIAQTRCG